MCPAEHQPPGVVETHSGIVFFAGDRAYKLKKAVDLGFLDFRSRAARAAACHREVELNRRLAPDVYLGVADVTGPDGQPCEHLVVMRRLPADRRLSTLASQAAAGAGSAAVAGHLRELARLLAAFHQRAATSAEIRRAAGPAALAGRWAANAAEMARFGGPLFAPAVADRVIALAGRYLAGRSGLLEGRVAAGRARDGHGDLLADDIFCLDDGPRVLDCLDFDDRLRWDDVLADVAFLAMDLEYLGRGDLAVSFLRDYREFAGDNWPASLAHHHIAYRAQVRAKVMALAWEQGRAPAGQQARALMALSLAHLEAGRVRLVLTGGLPGTGKSTVAAGLGEALGAVVLRSDVVRKEMAGLEPAASAAAPYGEGIYRPERTGQAYRELLGRARACLLAGESVVADASWRDPRWREMARALAGEVTADLAELCCVAPAQVAAARIAGRSAQGGGASDATDAVAREMAAAWVPWPSAAEVSTTAAPAEVVAAALAILGAPAATGT